MSTENENGLPSSEDLDAIAREEAISRATDVDTSINKVNESVPTRCSCGAPRQASQSFCYHCGQEFNAVLIETKRESIIDEDGSEHKGQRIRLIGEGWPNELISIKDCSDEELEKQIAGLQKLLAKAIQTQDYAQISIAAREFELGYRKHSRYVSAIRRREKIEQGAIRLNSRQHKVGAKTLSMEEQLAKQLGIPIEQARALKIILDAQKKS